MSSFCQVSKSWVQTNHYEPKKQCFMIHSFSFGSKCISKVNGKIESGCFGITHFCYNMPSMTESGTRHNVSSYRHPDSSNFLNLTCDNFAHQEICWMFRKQSCRNLKLICLQSNLPFWRHVFETMWMFPKLVVPPNHPFFIEFSIINHQFWDTTIFGITHMDLKEMSFPDPSGRCPQVVLWIPTSSWDSAPAREGNQGTLKPSQPCNKIEPKASLLWGFAWVLGV